MKLVADMGVTPVGLRPPYMKPISTFGGNNRQAIHLSVADPCADKPSHLSLKRERTALRIVCTIVQQEN